MNSDKVIWKFPLAGLHNHIMMPKGAEILTVQLQNNQPVLWAIVDTQNNINALDCYLNGIEYSAQEHREFETVLTGETVACLPEGKERVYINTIQKNYIVYHFFEIKDKQ